MAYCKNCGKETDWLSKSGYCKDCAEQILREREGKPPKAKKPIYKQAWFIGLCVLVAALMINAIAHTGEGTDVYDDVVKSFGVAGYIDDTDNLVVYTLASPDAKFKQSVKTKIADILIAHYGADKYVDIEQITIVVLSELDGGEPQIIAAWKCDCGDTKNVLDISESVAMLALAAARGT